MPPKGEKRSDLASVRENAYEVRCVMRSGRHLSFSKQTGALSCSRCPMSDTCAHTAKFLVRYLRYPRSSAASPARLRAKLSDFQRRRAAWAAARVDWAAARCAKCGDGFAAELRQCTACFCMCHASCYPELSKCPGCGVSSREVWPRTLLLS
jgi:hypothetical protein